MMTLEDRPAPSDSPSPPSNAPPVLGRWQFSLRGLLLLALLVAMGCALYASVRRMRQAEAERKQVEAELAEYRREYGILKVDDPQMLHAAALWTGEPNHWRWRVHFPPGKYDLGFVTTQVPASGIPKPARGWSADFTGVVEIAVAAFKDPKDGTWKYAISSRGPDGGTASTADMAVTPVDEGMSQSGGSVERDNSPVIVSPDQPLVLLRKRAVKASVRQMTSLEAHDGLMLWVQRTGDRQGGNYTRSW